MIDPVFVLVTVISSVTIVVALLIVVSRLGVMVSLLQRLVVSVSLLRKLDELGQEFRESGFGGQISQEQLDNLLPETLSCPACHEEIDLTFGKRLFRRFKCPVCGASNDLNDQPLHDENGAS